jgi:hypothetical protein
LLLLPHPQQLLTMENFLLSIVQYGSILIISLASVIFLSTIWIYKRGEQNIM